MVNTGEVEITTERSGCLGMDFVCLSPLAATRSWCQPRQPGKQTKTKTEQVSSAQQQHNVNPNPQGLIIAIALSLTPYAVDQATVRAGKKKYVKIDKVDVYVKDSNIPKQCNYCISAWKYVCMYVCMYVCVCR